MNKDPSSICLWCRTNLSVYAESVAEGKPKGSYTDKYCQSCYNSHKYRKNNIISDTRIKKDSTLLQKPQNIDDMLELSKDTFERLYIKTDQDIFLPPTDKIGNCGVYGVYLYSQDKIQSNNDKKILLYVGESNNLIQRFREHVNEIFKSPAIFGIGYEHLLDGYKIRFSLFDRINQEDYKKASNLGKQQKLITELNPIMQENKTNDKRIKNVELRKRKVVKALNLDEGFIK